MGKRVLSFSLKSLTLEVWKTGKFAEWSGSFSVTVKCHSSVAVMLYSPSNLGMNLATWCSSPDLYSLRRFAVDNMTRSPTLKGNERVQFLFA